MEKSSIIQTLSAFLQKNKSGYGIIKLGFFGSAAREEMRENSDIDIVVELERPNMLDLVGIKQDLEQLFKRPVDIVRLREQMNPFLKKRITREAVYV